MITFFFPPSYTHDAAQRWLMWRQLEDLEILFSIDGLFVHCPVSRIPVTAQQFVNDFMAYLNKYPI